MTSKKNYINLTPQQRKKNSPKTPKTTERHLLQARDYGPLAIRICTNFFCYLSTSSTQVLGNPGALCFHSLINPLTDIGIKVNPLDPHIDNLNSQ